MLWGVPPYKKNWVCTSVLAEITSARRVYGLNEEHTALCKSYIMLGGNSEFKIKLYTHTKKSSAHAVVKTTLHLFSAPAHQPERPIPKMYGINTSIVRPLIPGPTSLTNRRFNSYPHDSWPGADLHSFQTRIATSEKKAPCCSTKKNCRNLEGDLLQVNERCATA